MAAINNLSVDVAVPQVPSQIRGARTTAARLHQVNDPSVLFEEYLHYAQITRAQEKIENRSRPNEKRKLKSIIKSWYPKGNYGEITHGINVQASSGVAATIGDEKAGELITSVPSTSASEANGALTDKIYNHPDEVSDEEWRLLSRGVRTVTWSTCFYLITSDIIGPFAVPWSFAQLGYGPGIALYTIFGVLGSLSGWYIWRIFLKLDSDRYPLRDYGAAFFRVFGPTARHIINIFQSLYMILTVGSLILGMGQSIAQISQGTSRPVCYVVCLLIFTVIGFFLGQVRTLQSFGCLANFAVWMNIVSICISLGVVANAPPNFAATEASYGSNFKEGPIRTFANIPPDGYASGGDRFTGTVNGLNQAVYCFAGAILFFNFLSEMRHPWDFWKSLVFAQVFIYICYIFVGIFVYSFQGQYAFNPVQQGISLYNYQTAANICYIMTGFIAAALYGNIGIKIIYTNVLQELLGAPPLTVRSGKLLWVIVVPAYWAFAFVLGASIPQFSYVSGLLGAVCGITFTYSFPALLSLGFRIKKAAMLPEETFNESTRRYQRVDNGLKRWTRGFLAHWKVNTAELFYFLLTLVAAALGTYSSVEGIIGAFGGNSDATSWGCTAPV